MIIRSRTHAPGVQPFGWSAGEGTPIAVRIAGEESVVVAVLEYREDVPMFVQAWSARPVERLWAHGPVADSDSGYTAIQVGATAEYVLVSDPRNRVRILAAASGELTAEVSLSDRVEEICAPPPDHPAADAWLGVADERHQLVDLRTATLRAAGRPAWCPAPARWSHPPGASGVLEQEKPPEVAGFRAERVHVEGDLAVAGGVKSPGSALPRALGFDRGTREVRWHVAVAAAGRAGIREHSTDWAALSTDRYFTHYAAGSEDTWVVALKASTGAHLWETHLRPIFAVDRVERLVATPGILYVARTGCVDVLDALTGEVLGTVGTPTYDDTEP